MTPIPVYVGFDQKEAVAYHTFCQSVISRSSVPVAFHPLALNLLRPVYDERHTDGSNEFIYSRFLIPALQDFTGWALFFDGDMVCNEDLASLWALRNDDYAAMVVKHDYQTKYPVKYGGQKNQSYERKNWSSVVLWNCAHPSNRLLSPSSVACATGAFLHRFNWLKDEQIGELPLEWNWLVTEYPQNKDARLLHFTLGTPCFHNYTDCDHSEEWHRECARANYCDQGNFGSDESTLPFQAIG